MDDQSKIPVVIVGAGVSGRLALDIANSIDILVYGFLTDDDEFVKQEINDILVIANMEHHDSKTLLADDNVRIIVAEKDIERRRDLVEMLGKHDKKVINLVHPFHIISPYSKMGTGNLLNVGTIIHANAELGDYNLMESNCVIEADVHMGSYCTIQTGAKLGVNVELEDDVTIGMGAIIHAGVSIGEGAIVGPGSVVLKSVPAGESVFGNPAQSSGSL